MFWAKCSFFPSHKSQNWTGVQAKHTPETRGTTPSQSPCTSCFLSAMGYRSSECLCMCVCMWFEEDVWLGNGLYWHRKETPLETCLDPKGGLLFKYKMSLFVRHGGHITETIFGSLSRVESTIVQMLRSCHCTWTDPLTLQWVTQETMDRKFQNFERFILPL